MVKSGPIALFNIIGFSKPFSYYIFYHLRQERAQNLTVPSGKVKQFRCAFFNFTGGTNQTGGWSYRGVETEVINNTHVRCSASHLTSFVVLVSIVPTVGDPVSNWFSVVLELNRCMPAYADTMFSHPAILYLSFQLPLDYITYIGCSISLLCLLASIIFFLSLR